MIVKRNSKYAYIDKLFICDMQNSIKTINRMDNKLKYEKSKLWIHRNLENQMKTSGMADDMHCGVN